MSIFMPSSYACGKMSRSLTNRLRVLRLTSARPEATVSTSPLKASRCFSQSSSLRADEPNNASPPPPPPPPQARSKTEAFLDTVLNGPAASRSRADQQPSNAMKSLSRSMVFQTLNNRSNLDTSVLSSNAGELSRVREDSHEPYHFHVYSHKHNTHITCTKPNREPIISMSCGNIGFRKSRRGTFDSAYSLTKYVLERLIHNAWPSKIHRLELVLRGFGQGREAAVKVLMSPEGKVLRDKIVRVADSTRVKFGGTRSEKPRRL